MKLLIGCSQVSSISPNPHVEPPRRLLLQYLDLTDCMAIDDMGLKIVVKNCPQLVYLYLRRCIQITGELEAIANMINPNQLANPHFLLPFRCGFEIRAQLLCLA